MAEISPKIRFYNKEKLEKINSETLKLWNKYKIDMSIRELSQRTVDGYENDLQHWWIYIYDKQGNQCITDLDEDDITEFLYFCKTQGNNSRRMKRRMSSIAAFYKFLRRKKIIKENPMEFIERPKKDTDIITQTFLTPEQVELMKEKLIEHIKNCTDGRFHHALQLQCYALFSLSTMARVTAVSNTRWEQIDFENRVVKDVLEKEGYIVDLFFSKEVKDILLKLQKYRKENDIDDNGYVFVTTYDKKTDVTTTGTLNQWCKVIGNMIDVPTLHCHDWRHSGATLLKNKGMELEEVSKLLNHKSTDVTTKFYIKTDTTQLQANKDKFEI
ncbi:tyrosine-type recombinase/integrase [Anaerovorax sp. IOR16]|uniref:tyrosine-type recombinase/integrase n=1 Tax=Anaerovorax sp. IOR16 TaxID=2773458 RepID=UPI0019D13888|nr:tyrosine-type recombinase/integrase [Anaerovorax sp. IOR16]